MTRACLLTVLCAVAVAAQAKKMQLEIKLGKTQFIVKESLRVEVTFHNNGAAAVSIPAIADTRNRALSYYLTGPTFPKEFVFQYARAGARTIPGDPDLQSVPPGGKVTTPFSIERFVSEWKPGRHTLHAVCKLGGGTLESNTVSFEILYPEVKAGQVMADAARSSNPYMRAVFLASVGGANKLYQGFFEESHPDIESSPRSNFVEAFEIPSTASSVNSLWADFDRLSEKIALRHGWSDGHLAAVQEFQSAPITFDLHNEKLLRPGLMTRQAEALFVSWLGPHVTLTRVPRSGPATKVWEAKLPLDATDGRVWITPQAKVTAAFTAEHDNVVHLFLVQDGKVLATTGIEKAALLPQSEPGLAISSEGDYRVSVLVADPAQKRQISTVDWLWSPAKLDLPAKRQPAVTLRQDPTAAAVIYAFAPGVPRRDWVILLGSNIIVTRQSPERPQMLNGAPLLPLQLLPRERTSYLMLTHPKEIVYLTPLF